MTYRACYTVCIRGEAPQAGVSHPCAHVWDVQGVTKWIPSDMVPLQLFSFLFFAGTALSEIVQHSKVLQQFGNPDPTPRQKQSMCD